MTDRGAGEHNDTETCDKPAPVKKSICMLISISDSFIYPAAVCQGGPTSSKCLFASHSHSHSHSHGSVASALYKNTLPSCSTRGAVGSFNCSRALKWQYLIIKPALVSMWMRGRSVSQTGTLWSSLNFLWHVVLRLCLIKAH